MSFVDLPDLASRALGGGVVTANDEFFAARDNLVNPAPPTFDTAGYGAKGKVYDGWETRRRREPGYDFAVVRLGAPGQVRQVVVDTAHFTGNYPPEASVEGCGVEGYPSADELAGAGWTTLVPRSALRGDARNAFEVSCPYRLTHVRLCIYPDGGVARLRVPGEPVPDPRLLAGVPTDLAALELGGRVVECSDRFYGAPNNLLLPGLAGTMAEGWETARRRDQGNDWVLVRLATAGVIDQVELDSTHFKGNAPGSAALRGIDARLGALDDPAAWFDVLARTRLQPDTRHRFRAVRPGRTATHVRLDIYPDGGLARLRLFGTPDADELALRWFNSLPPGQARQVVREAGAAEDLVAARPLPDVRRLAPVWPIAG